MWDKVFMGQPASDSMILSKVYEISPNTFYLFVLSGVFSFMYNIIQFSIVHTLSPSATAFGGNFNKAALIFLSYIFMDPLPPGKWGIIIMMAIIGNIASFSYYSYLQFKAKEEEKKAKQDANKKGLVEEEEESDSDDSSSSESSA